MTTYAAGGYSNTQIESYGSAGDGAKRRDAKGVFPVTIAEILRNFNMNEDKLVVGDNEVSDVTLVAQVVSTKSTTTKMIFQLDDKSGGSIEANYWLDGDQDMTNDFPAPHTYVRVFGKIKSFGGRPQLNLFAWKPVGNPNIISAHVLQTVLAHHNTLNPVPLQQQQLPMAGTSQYPGNNAASGRGGGAGRFAASGGTVSYDNNDGFGGGNMNGMGSGVARLPAIQQEIYRIVANDKTGKGNGCHKDIIRRQLQQRFKPPQIEQALTALTDDGFLFNTIDSNYFAALEA